MFGGLTAAPAYVADTWQLVTDPGANTATWNNVTPTTSPGKRADAAMAFDVANQVAVLFGGSTSSAFFDDTWLWNGSAWTAVTGPSPSARRSAGLAYDPVRKRVVLFGGLAMGTSGGPNSPLQDTWEWDGAMSTWTQITPESSVPPARSGQTMVYDPQRERIVMYGGVADTVLDDVWEWDGNAKTWTQVVNVLGAVKARTFAVGAYDAFRRELVVFGGDDLGEQLHNQTLSLQYVSAVPIEGCVLSTADDDGDGLAGCADPDCWARCNPSCPPGVTCPATAPHCGDGVCSSAEDKFICPSDCH
jgi:N-acetylneuraminic acid mutarotase